MKRTVRLIALIGLTAILSGCFRQAEESFDAVTLQVPATSSSSTTLPVFTVEPTETLALLVTVAPSNSPNAAAATQTSEVDLPSNTPAQAFITPGSPLTTLVVVTNTPTPGTPASVTPGGLVTPTDAFNVEATGSSACEYTVRSGDSLFRIAINNDTTVEAIRTANELPNDTIFPGDVLIIPNCGGEDTADATSAPPEAGATALPDGWQIHIVASGETLGLIAQRYSIGQSRIVAANELANPDTLSVGQRLIIPAPE